MGINYLSKDTDFFLKGFKIIENSKFMFFANYHFFFRNHVEKMANFDWFEGSDL